MSAKKYSKRLGTISDKKIQLALDGFDLGTLKGTELVTAGLFGQNFFVTTDKGEYVFRGCPHYDWQFPSEQFFAKHLHENTKVPVPYPYLFDEDDSIFGWPYVLMPRLQGMVVSDDFNEGNLSDNDRLEIAQAQGEALAELQNLTWEFPGKYDLEKKTICPFTQGYVEWFYNEILKRLRTAKDHSDKTPKEDLDWVESILENSRSVMSKPFVATFVMQDYKPGNMLVDKTDGKWRVTGLFDLMENYFGNGEADISRMFCYYMGRDREDLAYRFVNAYLQSKEVEIEDFLARFPIFILHDRAIIWEWKQRMGNQKDDSQTFREWIEPLMKLDVEKINHVTN